MKVLLPVLFQIAKLISVAYAVVPIDVKSDDIIVSVPSGEAPYTFILGVLDSGSCFTMLLTTNVTGDRSSSVKSSGNIDVSKFNIPLYIAIQSPGTPVLSVVTLISMLVPVTFELFPAEFLNVEYVSPLPAP